MSAFEKNLFKDAHCTTQYIKVNTLAHTRAHTNQWGMQYTIQNLSTNRQTTGSVRTQLGRTKIKSRLEPSASAIKRLKRIKQLMMIFIAQKKERTGKGKRVSCYLFICILYESVYSLFTHLLSFNYLIFIILSLSFFSFLFLSIYLSSLFFRLH